MTEPGDVVKRTGSNPRQEILQAIQERPAIYLADLQERFPAATLASTLRELAKEGRIGYTGSRANAQLLPNTRSSSPDSLEVPSPSPAPAPKAEPQFPSPRRGRAKKQPFPRGQAPSLVCVRCGKSPGDLYATSLAEGKLLHVQAVRVNSSGAPEICGGQVVVQGEQWQHVLAPGIITPCHRLRSRKHAHLIRLGPPLQRHGRHWSGTALCGLLGTNPSAKWEPLASARICPDCNRARTLEALGR